MTTESLSHALRYLLANPDFWTADRLAQSAGVSKQTAYRALAATEAMGSDHCVRINKRVFAVGIRSGRQAELPVPPAPPAQCGKQRRLRCSLDEGHEGPHHDRPTGAEWEAKP